MAYTHRIQANRFELKYIISEPCAAGIRQFIRGYLEPDEYADPQKNCTYWIHSLYLDNPGLSLCNATVDGLKNRFKLRIRFYDFVDSNPVFFEIKRRVNDVILKERAAVRRASVSRLLMGRLPERTDLYKYDPKSLDSVMRFCQLRDTVRADGKVFVSYEREAYVSPNDDSVRVTFDRKLSTAPYKGVLRPEHITGWIQPQIATDWGIAQGPEYEGEGIVLELKFTNRFPKWMHHLAQSFGLWRVPMAKYVRCVESMSRYKLAYR